MTKITKTVRATIRTTLADSNAYDASTMSIARDGVVTALKDADKTFAGNDTRRYVVGHVDDLLADTAVAKADRTDDYRTLGTIEVEAPLPGDFVEPVIDGRGAVNFYLDPQISLVAIHTTYRGREATYITVDHDAGRETPILAYARITTVFAAAVLWMGDYHLGDFDKDGLASNPDIYHLLSAALRTR